MRRPLLCSNYVWLLAHGLPNAERRCVHIEQSYLLTAAASQTVDAEGSEQPCLFGGDQIWPHAERRSILNVLDLFHALRNHCIVHGLLQIPRRETEQEIVRCWVSRSSHSALLP